MRPAGVGEGEKSKPRNGPKLSTVEGESEVTAAPGKSQHEDRAWAASDS